MNVPEAESLELMYWLPGPLNDRTNAVLLQLRTELITVSGFDFVVLVYIEMVGVVVRCQAGRRDPPRPSSPSR